MKLGLRHTLPLLALLAFVVVAGISYLVTNKPSQVDLSKVEFFSGVTGKLEKPECFTKPKCLVMISAPWCPYCAESRPATTQLLREYGRGAEKGFLLVSQADELEKIAAEAKSYGEGAYYEPGEKFATSVGATSLPTWVLFDRTGKILSRSTGAYTSAPSLISEMGL